MFCNELPARGSFPVKLQWQNRDNTAHYDYNKETGKITCNVPDDTNPDSTATTLNDSVILQPKTLNITDLALDHFKAETALNIKVIEVREQCVLDHFKSKGDVNPNPAKVGLYLKLLSDMEKTNNE